MSLELRIVSLLSAPFTPLAFSDHCIRIEGFVHVVLGTIVIASSPDIRSL